MARGKHKVEFLVSPASIKKEILKAKKKLCAKEASRSAEIRKKAKLELKILKKCFIDLGNIVEW